MRRVCGLAWGLLFAGAMACGDTPEPVAEAPPDPATLVLAQAPEVTIGLLEGDDPYLLSGVTDATRLSDGRIVIADCSSGELRYFDVTWMSVRPGRSSGTRCPS